MHGIFGFVLVIFGNPPCKEVSSQYENPFLKLLALGFTQTAVISSVSKWIGHKEINDLFSFINLLVPFIFSCVCFSGHSSPYSGSFGVKILLFYARAARECNRISFFFDTFDHRLFL